MASEIYMLQYTLVSGAHTHTYKHKALTHKMLVQLSKSDQKRPTAIRLMYWNYESHEIHDFLSVECNIYWDCESIVYVRMKRVSVKFKILLWICL